MSWTWKWGKERGDQTNSCVRVRPTSFSMSSPSSSSSSVSYTHSPAQPHTRIHNLAHGYTQPNTQPHAPHAPQSPWAEVGDRGREYEGNAHTPTSRQGHRDASVWRQLRSQSHKSAKCKARGCACCELAHARGCAHTHPLASLTEGNQGGGGPCGGDIGGQGGVGVGSCEGQPIYLHRQHPGHLLLRTVPT